MKVHKATLPVIALSLMTVVSAVAGLNLALPSIARELGANQTQLTWIVDAYTVVFAGLLLFAGALSDKYGRRKVLLIGLAIYIFVSTFGLVVNQTNILILLRIIMGIGAALIMPSTLAVITSSFPVEERPKAVGVWVGVAGGGAVIGLFGSAFLMRYFSWHSFFALNLSLAVLAFLGALRFIPDSVEGNRFLDKKGGIFSILGIGGIVFGIIEGPERGWNDSFTVAGFLIGILSLIYFVKFESRQEQPLLDPRNFKNRAFSAGAISIFLQFFGQFGFIFVILQYLQFIIGFSPWDAVIRLLPLPFVILPVSQLSGVLNKKYPQKYLGPIGLVIYSLGMFSFSNLQIDLNYSQFVISLVLMATGMALAATPATTAITNSLPSHKQGVASAVNDTAREVGSAFGVAIVGAILNSSYRNQMIPAVKNLPPELADQITGSIAFTSVMPANGQSEIYNQLKQTAFEAFQSGISVSLKLVAVVALFGAVTIFLTAPKLSKI